MTYKTKLEPWKHQVTAHTNLTGRKAYALIMAMRTGKTKVTLDDYGRLEDEYKVKDLLVIAPAGVYETWLTAVEDHVGSSLRKRLLVHLWRAGAGKGEKRDLDAFLKNAKAQPRILLVNVEALSTTQRARDLCLEFLSQRMSMLVIDESTSIKGHDAKRAKFVVNTLAPAADYRRILTGLLTPQGPLDAFMQFYFLDPRILGCRKYTEFRARYAVTQKKWFDGRRFPVEVVVGYKNVEELSRLIEPHSYRVQLEDCYDLPPKMYQFRNVAMTDAQRKMYNEIRDYACAKVEAEKDAPRHVVATIVITQLLRMHQVLCGHCADSEGVPFEVGENRTRELVKLLSEFDGKAIIWASYDTDVRKIAAALERAFREGAGENDDRPVDESALSCVARFWGGNRNTREEEEKRFLRDPKCRFMVATAAAGGRGRTWTKASLVVYYSNTNNLEHRAQSEERAQGVGKSDQVLYVDMICPGTVEEKTIHALRDKIDLASMITRDNYREWLI